MTKEEYKSIVCPNCINYSKKCKEAICEEFINDYTSTRCGNYHLWTKCITKKCNGCGKCKERLKSGKYTKSGTVYE